MGMGNRNGKVPPVLGDDIIISGATPNILSMKDCSDKKSATRKKFNDDTIYPSSNMITKKVINHP